MSWGITEGMFEPGPRAALVLLALYIVPLMRLVSWPLECGWRSCMRINRVFGVWEHIVWPIRDYPATIFVAWIFVRNALSGFAAHDPKDLMVALTASSLLACGLASRVWKRDACARLIEFAIRSPNVHPGEFFDHMLCASGAVRHAFPSEPFQRVKPVEIDFRSGKNRGRIGFLSMAVGCWGTIWIAHLMISARNLRGDKFMRRAASSFAVIWSEMVVWLCRGALSIEGLGKIPGSRCPRIYLFTHMSFIDFSLVAILLAARPQGGGGEPDCMPIFLLAKDHFRDNFFLYRILGIGRVAEALGMIFVDRKSPDKIAEARRISRESVARLNAGDVIAIFPQGARAAPHWGPKGERRDAGYYTVGRRDRLRKDAAHLKKGAAHIALDAAIGIAAKGSRDPVTIVPVAISGTANACPRGSMRIKSNVPFKLKVGEPIAVLPPSSEEVGSDAARDALVENLHRRIDDSLKSQARIHAELERRFFEDIRAMFEPMEIDEISLAMKTWRGEDFLVHAILDAIYSCRPKDQKPFVRELARHMLGFESRDELLEFKCRVADAVPI